MRRLIVVALLALGGCKKSGDSGFLPVGTPPAKPVARAGENFKKLVSSSVTLDGSKSTDPAGGALTFAWSQTAGTPVVLSDATVSSPTFSAPALPDTLTFLLTVTGAKGSDSASVTVTVKKFLVTAPDTWWMGYGKSGTITATVTGTTSAPAFQWSGMAPWLSFSGDTTATLNLTTPKLTDFQNFEDVAGVAVFERSTQGRLQLMVTVTDGPDSDDDYVNFSAGSFADSVANENLAFGEPVFLNGGGVTPTGATVTDWAWQITRPDGVNLTTTQIFTPNKSTLSVSPTPTKERFVWFLPKTLGTWQVIITQTPGAVVKVLTLNCGQYVGVGNLTGAIPDPFKGECAACHAGQLGFLADFANSWKKTAHAHVLENLLDPADPFHASSQAKRSWNDMFDFGSDFSIDSRTVGWSRITSGTSGGWTEQAVAEGAVLKDTDWKTLVRKFPKTAGLSNVQCESCHGPGSEHAGDTAGIRKSYDSNVCSRCHSAKQDLWEMSGHGVPLRGSPMESPSGSASCNSCHTAQGFIVEMRAQQTSDPHPVLFAVSNLDRPVLPLDDRRGQTCQACHDPHQSTVGLATTGPNPQLRAYGKVEFRNGATTNAGRAAVCYMCHQSRTDTRADSTDMNVRRAPHDSTSAEMLAGTNGQEYGGWTYSVSPHGIAARFVSPGGENRQCLACHNDAQPGTGAVGFSALGGHSFNMSHGTGGVIATEAAYTGASSDATLKRFTVATGASFLRRVVIGDGIVLDGVPNTVVGVGSPGTELEFAL